jgi:uncharacterized protein YjbJ (UPF0337 family)
MDENEIKGAARDALGKVKDGVGGLTGDTGMQVDGKMDQAAGQLQGKFGDAKDQLDDTAGIIADKASELAGRARAALRDVAETARRGAVRRVKRFPTLALGLANMLHAPSEISRCCR